MKIARMDSQPPTNGASPTVQFRKSWRCTANAKDEHKTTEQEYEYGNNLDAREYVFTFTKGTSR